MPSRVISFRLPDDEVAALEKLSVSGESLNQTAQRLLSDLVTGESKPVDNKQAVDSGVTLEMLKDLEQRMTEKLETTYAQAMDNLNFYQREVDAKLGEFPA